ncbi:MAG: BlaI/MecI/CopY family transcriptional regulator [bacterium]
MARKKAPTLTDAELRIMQVVWEKGQATVTEVVEDLPRPSRPAYNTVLTTMRILEQKGYLQHVKAGRAHIFQPLVSRPQAQKKAMRHMLRSFFDDSPELLLVSILQDENISPDELKRLREMIGENKGG